MVKKDTISRKKIIATAMTQLMISSQGNGADLFSPFSQSSWSSTSGWQLFEQDDSYGNNQKALRKEEKAYVYRDGLIRRHLDEITMIFRKNGHYDNEEKIKLSMIPDLTKTQRDDIRKVLEKAYLAHWLDEADKNNLEILRVNIEKWKGFETSFDGKSQLRLKAILSDLTTLLQGLDEEKNQLNCVTSYLSLCDIDWISTCSKIYITDCFDAISHTLELLKNDLSKYFGKGIFNDYLTGMPIYRHSTLARMSHLKFTEKPTEKWATEKWSDLFMELFQLKCSVNSMGNAEDKRTAADKFKAVFTNTECLSPLYELEVRKIKEHIDILQACLLKILKLDENKILRGIESKYSSNNHFKAFLEEQKEIWILALDGGGVRGKIAAEILRKLSKELEAKGAKCPLIDCFHFKGGTSVGGLIVLAMNSLDENSGHAFTMDEIADMLEHDQAKRIFPPLSDKDKSMAQGNSFAYSPQHIEKFLLANFGYNKLASIQQPTMVITHSNRTQKPLKLRNYDSQAMEVSEMNAGRATSAAPTYFPATTICYSGMLEECLDGGVSINNPAAESLAEVLRILEENGRKIPRINILSIGTGKVKFNYPHGSNKTGVMGLIDNLEGTMRESSKQVHKRTLVMMENLALKGVVTSYYRINPCLEEPIELDDSSPKNLEKLDQLTKADVFEDPRFESLVAHLAKENGDVNQNQYIRISKTKGKNRNFL